MDTDLSTLPRVIRELHQRRQLVDSAIAALEVLMRDTTPDYRAPKPRKRRGRKSMSPEDREEVSKRMREYWAGRRAGAAAVAS
jgi:hypothetical protein